MKTIISEYTANYETYSFGYTIYALPTPWEYDQAYAQWYLPYTASLDIEQHIFYLCRSLRVDTKLFENNSENRRIIRKAQEHDLSVVFYDKADFNITDPDFREFCLGFAQSRFSHGGLTPERFDYILSRDYVNTIVEIRSSGRIIGYDVLCKWDNYIHHFFCFYDTDMMEALPLGKYLMRYTIDRAKTQGIEYVYLGTCYNAGWLYKARDFASIQRRDGNTRQTDLDQLKLMCKSDAEPKSQDQFKLDRTKFWVK